MSVKWTGDQIKAITRHGANVLVAAAAGSGKTAVLVERIIRQITDDVNPVDVDSMLVTTFTEAAAQTMRQKLTDAILKKLADNPTDKNLLHQMIGVNRADICTIHAFCLKTIRDNFHLTDLDPEFTIGDNNELELMKEQLISELFDELYEECDENFLLLTEVYSTQKSDDNLAAILLKMYSFIKSMPFYDKWIEERLSELENFSDIDSSLRAKKIKQSAKLNVDAHIDMICEAIEYVGKTPSVAGYIDALRDDLNKLNTLNNLLDHDWDSIVKFLNEIEFATLRGATKEATSAHKAMVNDARDSFKEKCIKYLRNKLFYATADIVYDDMKYEKEVAGALCKLFLQFDEKFSAAKKERNLLDFNDLEHLCLDILSDRDDEGNIIPSELALSLKEKYSQILVDEYQDSNELQEAIFSLISNGHNLFMVGDIKQSIYRFRHTNPMLFKSKKDTYTDDGENNIRVIMGKNFRSREAVVDGVNSIFTQITSQTVGEIDYDDSEKLYFGATYPTPDGEDPRVEINICTGIVDEKDDEISDELKDIDGIEWEAHHCAQRIKKLIKDKFMVCDSSSGQMRPITYRDIVILFRSPKRSAPVFTEVLKSYGIPVFSDAESGYFMSEEVRLMISVLCITDNPRQDLRLLAVMRSPVGGFNESELLEIRMADRNTDIYGALEKYCQLEDELADKCRAFLSKLNNWRDMSKYLPTHQLIWEIYKETNYYVYAGAMDDGEQRQANLILLYERARIYEQTSFKGLFNFINYIENIRSSNHGMDSAKVLGENQNLVRIMSVHKSKGLEFPVVFVASMDRQFNNQDIKDRVLIHRELGFGIDVVDTVSRYHYPSLSKRAMKEVIKYEDLSEELRLIYVAFTRAKEMLVLSAYSRDTQKSINKWLSASKRAGDAEHIRIHDTASAKCLADMVMPAILRSKSLSDVLSEYGFINPEEENNWIKEDNTKFSLSLLSESDLTDDAGECDVKTVTAQNHGYTDFIDDRLNTTYKHQLSVNIPSKVSVTELKRLSNFEIDGASAEFYVHPLEECPSFLSEKSSVLSGAEKGSIMHYVMQNITLCPDMSEEYIKNQINEFVRKDMLAEEQAKAVDANKISAFFRHPLGKRMLASKNIIREMPFEIELEASDIYNDASYDEKILLQGIIDCLFEEDDGFVLVDYKTDYLSDTPEAKEQIAKKYEYQLEYYKKAAEKIFKKEVKEKKLYLFSVNSVIEY